jgi:protease-4
VASLSTIATSGGYYSALGARYIFADPGTITGSIGVIMTQPNLESMLDKLGIKVTILKSGSFKDLTPITRDLEPEEKVLLNSVLKDIHRQFIEAVSDARDIPLETATSLSDGRIFTGNQALKQGLVDELGNFSSAVDKAASLAGIKGEPKLIYPQKERFDFLMQMLEEGGANSVTHLFLKILANASQARALYAP